jgi:cell division protein FtsB
MGKPATPASRPATGGIRVRRPAGTTDSRSRRRRMLTVALFAGLVFLLINAIVGENGYLATLQLRRTEAALTASVATVRLENQRLRDERIRLESDPDTIERTIRERLGYIRPGEVTVVVHDAPPVSSITPAP